jgi:hypothetical protein
MCRDLSHQAEAPCVPQRFMAIGITSSHKLTSIAARKLRWSSRRAYRPGKPARWRGRFGSELTAL